MEKWTVILNTPNGLHFEVVEADAAEWSDDGKSLEFFDMDATTDVMAALMELASGPRKEMSPQEAKGELTRLLRTFGRVKVASFDREAVLGHFLGLKANVDVSVTPRGD